MDTNNKIEDEKKIIEKDKITLGGIVIVSRKEDKYINATMLCSAGKSLYGHWKENNKTNEFLHELSITLKISEELLVYTITDGVNETRGTWVHPRVAINIAHWVSPKFAVEVTGWVCELLTAGTVKLERPIKALTNLTEMDIEVENLENKIDHDTYSNCSCTYISYIGNGLIKVGYTDSRLDARINKHQKSESLYPQWRIISLIKISGKPIDKLILEHLAPYKFDFNKQKEIFEPKSSLEIFIKKIKDFCITNDDKLARENLEKKVSELTIEILELKLKMSIIGKTI